ALSAANYGPFNVYSDRKNIFISYAAIGEGVDEAAGAGYGYINVWRNGQLVRLANRGPLNAPWGMFRNDCYFYVGNFGDGVINIYRLTTYKDCKTLEYCEP